MSRRGWTLFAAMGVLWGIPYLLIKIAVGGLSPTTLVLLRTSTGALLLLPFALARGGLRPLLPRWRIVLLYTAVEVGIPWLLLSDAERRLSSSFTGLMVATVPLIGAVLAAAARSRDRMTLRQVGGLGIGLLGVAALLGLDLSRTDLAAVGELGIVVCGYALGPMIIARRFSDVSPVGVVAVSLLLTAIVWAPLGILQWPHTPPGAGVITAVAILAVVCTAIAFLVFFALIAEVGPIRATIITYVNPAIALALGAILLHEPITAGKLVGFALILAGSYLSTRRTPARPAPVRSGEALPEPGVASP